MAAFQPPPFLALAVLAALPAFADRGDLFLDLGTGGLVQEEGRQPAWAGSMGFHFGIDPRTEVGLSVQYGRFLVHKGFHQVELTGASLSGQYSLLPSLLPDWLQPAVGFHGGMVRLDGDWKADLGPDLLILAGSRNLLQAYASAQPGIWIGSGNPDLWFVLGMGFRFRLPY